MITDHQTKWQYTDPECPLVAPFPLFNCGSFCMIAGLSYSTRWVVGFPIRQDNKPDRFPR